MLFKMYAPYTYGLPKNYEDIFNKFSKIQKPTEAIHKKPFRNSQKLAVCNAHCIFSVQLSTGILGYVDTHF